jgi:ankyrin repeat protein
MTKDGALHALSRVNVEDEEAVAQEIDIMQCLKDFVSKEVNLNRHNRDGDHPLSAFIRNRDQRREDQGNETGPTTAKFLEVLLWKTSKRGTLNDLNDINVDMMNRRGATALYEAATLAQPESVRSLIEAGANVHARLSK